MADHPIESVVVDGVDVAKSGFRSYAKSRHRLRVADADEVRNTDLAGQFGGLFVADLGGNFDLDTEDTTTADNGTTCIVDLNGLRFKLAQIIDVTTLKIGGQNAITQGGGYNILGASDGTSRIFLGEDGNTTILRNDNGLTVQNDDGSITYAIIGAETTIASVKFRDEVSGLYVVEFPEQGGFTIGSDIYLDAAAVAATGNYEHAQHLLTLRIVPGAATPGTFGWVGGYIYGQPGTVTGSNLCLFNTVQEIADVSQASQISTGYEADINYNVAGGADLRPGTVTLATAIASISGGLYSPDKAFLVHSSNGQTNAWNVGFTITADSVKYAGFDIGGPSESLLDAVIFAAKNLANDTDNIVLQRFTDTSPTGHFLRGVNAANNADLFSVGIDGAADFKQLKIGGAAAITPSGGYNVLSASDGTSRAFLGDSGNTSILRNDNGLSVQSDDGLTTYATIGTAIAILFSGALKTLLLGAADSGGSGFKMVRVTN